MRPAFRGSYEVRGGVSRILMTTGSTNPDHALEHMLEGVRASGIDCEVVVIIGSKAMFDEKALVGLHAKVLRGVTDLAPFMRESDVVISAAGTTLYELACVGVPTVALPIVENQLPNACGFLEMGLGPAARTTGWDADFVADALSQMLSFEYRLRLSDVLRAAVDGYGARRIAKMLLVPG